MKTWMQRMVFRSLFFLVVALLCSHYSSGQTYYYPRDYFQSPMDTPLFLSAPFGSLRDNHFHSGMDIRTYEKEGLPVYAVADGVVSRIKVSSYGYGKALYIDHPNGYTSVYGHLQSYADEIGAQVKKLQYAQESFDFDQAPGKYLPVKKGQLIGYSGNSGTSTGPHLHFEIRNSKTEEPLNPLLFGIPVMDSNEPYIKRIVIYNLDQNRPLLMNDFPVTKWNVVLQDSLWYYQDTIDVAQGTIGFAVEAYDRLISATQDYSLYSSETFFDRRQVFGFRLDRITFENTKSINAHIDYELYRREGVRFQKCFLDDGNSSGIYNYMRNKGRIRLRDDKVHLVQMNVFDYSGHAFRLVFPVRGFVDQTPKPGPASCRVASFYPRRDNIFRTKDIIVEVPSRALYDTLDFCLDVEMKDKNIFSSTFKVHDSYTPLHKNIGVSIRVNTPPANADKLLLAYYTKDGFVRSAGGAFEGGWVTARSGSFGNYFVTSDTIAPIVKPLNIEKDIVTDTILRFRADDNFSGIASYRATLNGKWVLTEYDPKRDLIFYIPDQNTPWQQPVDFVLKVVDRKGNGTIWSKQIRFLKN